MIRLAFGNKARSGKDTACDHVLRLFGGSSVRIADGVYSLAGKVQNFLGKPVGKDPALLQLLGIGIRDVYGQNIWIDQAIDKIRRQNEHLIVVPDMRFKNEFEKLKKENFITIRINRPDRPIDRNPNHISEIDLDDIVFDYEINNDRSVYHLYGKINLIIADNYHVGIQSFKFTLLGEEYAVFVESSRSLTIERYLQYVEQILFNEKTDEFFMIPEKIHRGDFEKLDEKYLELKETLDHVFNTIMNI